MTPADSHQPALVRVTHWINALAVLVMIFSGWRIYDAAPLFDFTIPARWTLGGWLAGAIQWHLAAFWVLVANGAAYCVYALASRRLATRLRPPSWRSLADASRAAMRGRLPHVPGEYNPLQRASYLCALATLAVLVVSGLVVWKPVQLFAVGRWLGDYEGARLLHFCAMCALAAFVVVHVAMVVLVPRTLADMLWTRRGARGVRQ